MQAITFVGLDVHKTTIAVSVAAAGRDGEVHHLGRVENRPEVVRRLVERLRRGGQELRVGYEAGPLRLRPAPAAHRPWLPLRRGGAGPDPAQIPVS